MIVPKILNIAGLRLWQITSSATLDGHSEIVTLPVHAKIHDEILIPII